MVFSNNCLTMDNTKYKFLTKLTLEENGLKIADDYNYCAGTCFAISRETAITIKNLPLNEDNFKYQLNIDFSFAHAMERYLGYLGMQQGIDTNKSNIVRTKSWQKMEKKLKKYNGFRLLEDANIKLSNDVICRNLETFIEDYRLETISVDSLKVKYQDDQKEYSITETIPYKFLLDPENEENNYLNYCHEHRRTDYQNYSDEHFNKIKNEDFLNRYLNLIDSIKSDGFQNETNIVIDDKFLVLDGLHRACVVRYLQGPDAKIKVLMIKRKEINLNRAIRFTNIII